MQASITVPSILYMLTGEKLPLSIDCTGVLSAGDIISSPSATMQLTTTNETIPSAIVVAPTVSGTTVVNLTISGTPLRASATYSLVVTFNVVANNTTKTQSVELIINVIR